MFVLAMFVASTTGNVSDAKGDPKSARGAVTKATVDGVDYEIIKCVRNGTKVTFEIILLCENGDKDVGGGARNYDVYLTASDGTSVKPGLVETLPKGRITLREGVKLKLQITKHNVPSDITEFGSVVLAANGDTPDKNVVFKKIAITKK
jgi:hypothetical protein